MTDVSNRDDTIDSRDIIARLEELDGERQALVDTLTGWREAVDASPDDFGYRQDMLDASKALDDWDGDNGDELKALRALADEAADYADDWHHGATLVRDSHFTDYARELADDIGAVDRNASWPMDCIDWGEAARRLQQDYTSVEFDGVTYWVR